MKGCDATAHRIGRSVMSTGAVQRSGGTVGAFRTRGCVESHVSATAGSERTGSNSQRALRDFGQGVGPLTPSRPDESKGGARLSLWWAPLDVAATALQGLAGCLSPDERERAERFGRARDRRRFLAARGWLRHVLASELSCASRAVPIVTDDRGKPMVACSDLSFSASRTADVALFAVSWSMEVGVDIEAVRATAEIDGIVSTFMSPAERRALDSLLPAQRHAAFFQCWTRKEAYGKAIGTGLGFSLREIELWQQGSGPVTVSGWAVHQIDVSPGFAGAVAGADTSDWVPPVPRRLRVTNLDRSYRPLPGRSRSALAMSRG